MAHALVELAPGRQEDTPTAEAPADRGGAGRQGRSSRRAARAERPVRHRQAALRHGADLRELQATVARWAR